MHHDIALSIRSSKQACLLIRLPTNIALEAATPRDIVSDLLADRTEGLASGRLLLRP